MGWFHGAKPAGSGSGSAVVTSTSTKEKAVTTRLAVTTLPESSSTASKSNLRPKGVYTNYQPPITEAKKTVSSSNPVAVSSDTKVTGASSQASSKASKPTTGTGSQTSSKAASVSKLTKEVSTTSTTALNSGKQVSAVAREPVEEASYAESNMKDQTTVEQSVRQERSMSEDIQTYDESAITSEPRPSRANHLNSLFNGHLMKWKYEAEEGTMFVRVPAFLGGLAQMTVSICAFVYDRPESVQAYSIVLYTGIIIMSLMILILDGRFLSTHPLSVRSHLRNIVTRNFNILRFLWGRGLLYITVGVLTIAQMWLPTIIAGAFSCFVGLLAVVVGIHASRKFAALRNSLSDDSFLLLVFANYDYDADGYIDPQEFAWLLVDLGVELDDRYSLRAFNFVDKDKDRLISFEEFSQWWFSGFMERGRKSTEDDDSYRRMDGNL